MSLQGEGCRSVDGESSRKSENQMRWEEEDEEEEVARCVKDGLGSTVQLSQTKRLLQHLVSLSTYTWKI